ncbi:MAG: hypothetical protein O2887_03480, partial [Bacteroidetes bacterium]|nr:hypothetical protein [Bacteroidota bacterium]
NMKRIITILMIVVLLGCNLLGYSQKKSREYFKDQMAVMLKEKFNITFLPPAFTDCGYNHYLKDGNDAKEAGYHMARICIPLYLSQLKFSDGGVKMMATYGEAFIVTCYNQVEAYENQINRAKYCGCLQSEYVKNKIGTDHLNDLKFTKSEFHEKILQSCFINAMK